MYKYLCRNGMDGNDSLTQITDDPFASVKIPEYKNLILGRFFFIMSLRMMSTLVGWWIYELTNDPFAIGLIGFVIFATQSFEPTPAPPSGRGSFISF